ERHLGPPSHLHAGDADYTQREGDIFPEGALGKQPEVLENDAQRAAQGRHPPGPQAPDVAAVDPDLPLRRPHLAVHELQERRLAAPRLPDDEDEFPGVNLEVEALERDHVLAVAKADVVELQHPRRAAEILAPHTLSCRQAPPRGEYRNSGARRATIEHRA